MKSILCKIFGHKMINLYEHGRIHVCKRCGAAKIESNITTKTSNYDSNPSQRRTL